GGRAEQPLQPPPGGAELLELPGGEAAAGAARAFVAVEHVVVGLGRPVDHGGAEPADRVHHGAGAAAGDRVGGEHDAGGGGVDHALDDHGHPDPGPVDLVGLPVGGGALVVERGPAAADRVDHRVGAFDAEVGVLLPGEAGVGQVLGGGAGAHGDRAAAH